MSSKTGKINIRTLLDGAQRLAEQHGHEYITLEHLLLAIVCTDDSIPVIEAHGADNDELVHALTRYLDKALIPVTHTQPVCTRLVQSVVEMSVMVAVSPVLLDERFSRSDVRRPENRLIFSEKVLAKTA